MYGVGMTNPGRVRENNEDSIYVSNEPIGKLENLFIVSDGMGGHNAGEIASGKGIEYFCEYIEKNSCLEDDILDYMVDAVKHSNALVYELSTQNDEMKGMGATFSACTFLGNKCYFVHIGDSRIYILKNKNSLIQLTSDHTYVNEMVKAGEISPEEAKNHRLRNVITRALGSALITETDAFVSTIEENDILLICSDGLTNMIEPQIIKEILSANIIIEEKANKLVELANQNGGTDNISVIVIETGREPA